MNARAPVMEEPILAHLPAAHRIDWRSPLADDDHAEYRDAGFLRRVGLEAHAPALAAFWPKLGPQWVAGRD